MVEFILGRVENIVGKWRKCWLQHFQNGFSSRVIETLDGLEMGSVLMDDNFILVQTVS